MNIVHLKVEFMKTRFFVIVVSIFFIVSTAHAEGKRSEAIKASGAAVSGAIVGGATFAAVGSGGLAIAGTAITIGAAPFVVAGTVIGLAGYGIYRVAAEPGLPNKHTSPSRPAQTVQVSKH